MISNRLRACSASLAALVTLGSWQARADTLEAGFRDPPAAARPRVWWHWMNGNVTQEGVRLDLEWMKRVGLGGFQMIDGDLHTPQIVAHPAPFMSADWKAALHLSVRMAQAEGLEMAIASAPGWSETGGPWVTPEQAMKKLVWSETTVVGGKPFRARLASPPDVAGPFQDVSAAGLEGRAPGSDPRFYRDVRVLAFPTPPDAVLGSGSAHLTSSSGDIDPDKLAAGQVGATQLLTARPGEAEAWIRLDYDQPQLVRTFTVGAPSAVGFGAPPSTIVRLEAAGGDGRFGKVVEFTLDGVGQRTESFPALTARSFRVVFTHGISGVPPVPPGVVGPSFPPPAPGFHVSILALHRDARVRAFEDKAGFAAAPDYYVLASPDVDGGSVVRGAKVLDLTRLVSRDGMLDWTPPPGDWTVLRLGYSLTGSHNHPAEAVATGLEVDKLSARHVRAYLDRYFGLYAGAVGEEGFGPRGVRALLTDSIESGPQNWTDDMLAEFRQRRGYDAGPWLPALTGRIVDDPADTDRFLYDFRRTIAELLADDHYGVIADYAHARGMTVYGEALEDRRPQLGDDIDMRRRADAPMGAMWFFPEDGAPDTTYTADLLGAASIAHVYGQNLVAAESLTAWGQPWGFAPRDLRHVVDREFALGVNRIVIHTSPHQPLPDGAPGMALANVLGQYFSRTDTWAEQARPWIDYIARSSQMLQQGRFVADVAWFHGEERPLTGLYGDGLPADIPHGYGFDFVGADAVLNRLTVRNGRLETPAGASYRILYLGGDSGRMTLPVLRRIDALVRAGAVVVGERPTDSPSLADQPAEFTRIADALWPGGSSGWRRLGAGRIGSGLTPDAALAQLGVVRDADFGDAGPDIMTLHRRTSGADIYYVANQGRSVREMTASFRVTGRAPEMWDAVNGSTTPLSYRSGAGVTHVNLSLAPLTSTFVVFRKPSTATSYASAPVASTEVARLAGAWRVRFQPRQSAPVDVTLTTLSSWSQLPDPAIKYYSGAATYSLDFQANKDWMRPGSRIVLDLGDVRDLASVRLNGRDLGVVWTSPWKVDLSSALRPGQNHLEVQVTNLWVNRLIGDAQPGAHPTTVTAGPTYAPDAALRPAGLLGPVRLVLESPAT